MNFYSKLTLDEKKKEKKIKQIGQRYRKDREEHRLQLRAIEGS